MRRFSAFLAPTLLAAAILIPGSPALKEVQTASTPKAQVVLQAVAAPMVPVVPVATTVTQPAVTTPPVVVAKPPPVHNVVSAKPADPPPPPRQGAYRGRDGCYYGNATPSPEVERIIREAAAEFGVDPERALRIADGESDFHEDSGMGGGNYGGVFQQSKKDWPRRVQAFNDEYDPDVGNNIYDAKDNARVSMRMMSAPGGMSHWQCKG